MARRAKVIPLSRAGRRPAPRAGEARAARGADDRGFVELHRCRDQSEALVIRGLLDSEGIPSLLRSRLVHSVHPFSVGDQGEVVVLVPESEAGRARLLVARLAPGPSFP